MYALRQTGFNDIPGCVRIERCRDSTVHGRTVAGAYLPQGALSGNMAPCPSPDTTGLRMPDLRSDRTAQDTPGLDGLLVEVAGGSRNAFESLYRATSSKLFSVCLRVLSDRAEAEDVLQEVFTTIWHKAHQFDPNRASPIAWLAMIARNKAIDRVRAQPARGTLAPIEFADDIADTGASPLQTAVSADERDRLEACMGQLDARRQSLIRAAFFDGSTYEELAQRIASPLGSVKSWIRRGLLQLRGCLEA
jgi:RNA polymerase sigma-70 factor (ECF subfamily)